MGELQEFAVGGLCLDERVLAGLAGGRAECNLVGPTALEFTGLV